MFIGIDVIDNDEPIADKLPLKVKQINNKIKRVMCNTIMMNHNQSPTPTPLPTPSTRIKSK